MAGLNYWSCAGIATECRIFSRYKHSEMIIFNNVFISIHSMVKFTVVKIRVLLMFWCIVLQRGEPTAASRAQIQWRTHSDANVFFG